MGIAIKLNMGEGNLIQSSAIVARVNKNRLFGSTRVIDIGNDHHEHRRVRITGADDIKSIAVELSSQGLRDGAFLAQIGDFPCTI